MPKILTGALLAAALLPVQAQAQSACGQRQLVVQKLEAGYGEAFVGGGMQSATAIYEVWFSEEKGTWTILMTRSDGITCIMAAGTNWQEVLPGKRKPHGIPG